MNDDNNNTNTNVNSDTKSKTWKRRRRRKMVKEMHDIQNNNKHPPTWVTFQKKDSNMTDDGFTTCKKCLRAYSGICQEHKTQ